MNKRIIIPIIAALLVLLGALAFVLSRDDNDQVATIASFEQCQEAGYPIAESYPARCKVPNGPSFTEDIGNELEKNNLIKVESPRPNQTISSPVQIKGEARGNWYFEASFPARLVDANGKELAIIPVQAKGEWMTTEFVPFDTTMTFPTPTTATGKLILEKDNPSGLPENDDQLIIPVKFANYSADKMTVKVFFGNSTSGAECEKVTSVQREIAKTTAVGKAAIEELLKGPTAQETASGFNTSINSGVKINSLVIQNGTAKIDFSEELDQNIGGSCRVAAIRAQITETLKQFPTVNQVVISVNGRTEDILQP
jgi:hypothetical protein